MSGLSVVNCVPFVLLALMMAYLAGLLIWLLVSGSVLVVLKLCSVCAASLDDGLSGRTPYLASGEGFV